VRYNECNGVTAFITRNWLEILQSVGIIGGLFTTAYTLRTEGNARRIENLFTVTKNHREIWSELLAKPELSRVLRAKVDLKKEPITEAEELFVLFLTLHLATSFKAKKHGMYFAEHGLVRDMQEFFVLPIPSKIWKKIRRYQQPDFVSFVEKLAFSKAI